MVLEKFEVFDSPEILGWECVCENVIFGEIVMHALKGHTAC